MIWGWLHGFSESHSSLVKYREIVSAWWDAVRTQLEHFRAVQTLAMPRWQLWNVLGGGEGHLFPICAGISAWVLAHGRLLARPLLPNVLVFPPKSEETGDHIWESSACHHTERQSERGSSASVWEPQRTIRWPHSSKYSFNSLNLLTKDERNIPVLLFLGLWTP